MGKAHYIEVFYDSGQADDVELEIGKGDIETHVERGATTTTTTWGSNFHTIWRSPSFFAWGSQIFYPKDQRHNAGES